MPRNPIALGVTAAAAILLGGTALQAQNAPARDDAATTPDDSGTGFRIPGVSFLADVDGGKTVKLTFSRESDLQRLTGQTKFALTFSGTFDDDSKRGLLVTQSGVPGGFGTEFSTATIFALRDLGPPSGGPQRGPLRSPWLLLQGTAGLNVDDFNYRDPISFDKASRRRTGFSTSGSVGVLTSSGLTFVGAGFRYEHAYKAPDKRILCKASTPVPFECVQGVFGPPEGKTSASAFGVLRAIAPFGTKIPLAIEIRPSYDFEQRVLSVEAPVYFFLDDKHHLRGGAIFSWNDKDKNLGLGLFIGVPFDLLHSSN